MSASRGTRPVMASLRSVEAAIIIPETPIPVRALLTADGIHRAGDTASSITKSAATTITQAISPTVPTTKQKTARLAQQPAGRPAARAPTGATASANQQATQIVRQARACNARQVTIIALREAYA